MLYSTDDIPPRFIPLVVALGQTGYLPKPSRTASDSFLYWVLRNGTRRRAELFKRIECQPTSDEDALRLLDENVHKVVESFAPLSSDDHFLALGALSVDVAYVLGTALLSEGLYASWSEASVELSGERIYGMCVEGPEGSNRSPYALNELAWSAVRFSQDGVLSRNDRVSLSGSLRFFRSLGSPEQMKVLDSILALTGTSRPKALRGKTS